MLWVCGGCYEQQLANRTGLSRRTLQDWKNQGRSNVKTYTAFLNQLGVTDPRQFDDRYPDSHRPFSEFVRKGLPLVLPSTEWEPDWMPSEPCCERIWGLSGFTSVSGSWLN